MKNWIKNLSIRSKVLFIVGINVFSFITIALVVFNGLSKLYGYTEEIVVYSNALSLHQSNDMMHDAIRGDFQKTYNIDSNDVTKWKEFMQEFDEHVGIFTTNYKEISDLPLDEVSKKQIEDAKPLIFEYLNYSKALFIAKSEQKLDFSKGDGITKVEGFNKRFGDLEKVMADITDNLNTLIKSKEELPFIFVQEIKITLGILIFSIILITFLLSLYIIKLIVTPVVLTESVLGQLSIGEIPKIQAVDGKDETARMLNSLNGIVSNLVNVKDFVTAVGNGNFDTEVSVFNNQGAISDSLNKMKLDLKQTAEDDKKRGWATEGMAKFGDILRNSNDGIEVLSTNIINGLVKYVGANQGGLFVVNDSNPKDKYLELSACYAWDKTKHIDKRVNEGEGLVGQCWQEADVVYITEVPQDFVNITSGLGGANPSCILIVPLTVNDVTFGVIELASFNLFEDYQIEFIKKLGESIASTLSGAQTNERTKILLEQSQQNTEEMRAQEEEMRQNMEEMQATSEEAERKAMNYEAAIARLNDEIAELSKN